ncbi:lipoate--protein ligase family protein [bacterium]|nr:lipoate--protein ligase family protein [bacterium]
MKFIPFEIKTGAENMRIDCDLLEDAISSNSQDPVLRLYGWSPACVSLGRNQRDDFVDTKFLRENNIDIVRRLTGGRALLHDNEITYSFVCPFSYLKNGENVVNSYKEISQILIDAFKKLDIELDFGGERKLQGHKDYCMLVSTGADLCYKGKKLIGSAQFRKNGYILQHGSILYDYNKNLLEKIFKEDVDTSTITSIKEINPNITQKDIINSIIKSKAVSLAKGL